MPEQGPGERGAQRGEAERSAGPRPGRTTGRRRPVATAGLALAVLAAALLAAEGFVRARGYRPWTPDPVAARVEPGGSLYRADPILGYALRPGAYAVELPGGLRFRATHDARGHRVTGPAAPADGDAPDPAGPTVPGIWIFGDSFSYGWAVDDEQTYPWLLQTAFPRQRVVNLAVGGYGTLQALLQLEQALRESPPPAAVVLAHNFFHDPRNTFSRLRRREVAPWNRLGPIRHPLARIAPDGGLVLGSAPVDYRELPLMRRSALAELAATAYDLLDDRRLRSHEVTRALLGRFVAAVRASGAPAIVATLEASPANDPILAFAASLGARSADVSVDLQRPENTNLPQDGHPSPLAHRRYARRLAAVIRAALPDAP